MRKRYKQPSRKTPLFTAMVHCSDHHKGEGMKDSLYRLYEEMGEIAFVNVESSRFLNEVVKIMRKIRTDLLIIEAYDIADDGSNIKTIREVKEKYPNCKIIVTTNILTEEIKEWLTNGEINGYQLVPYQEAPFLNNVKNVMLGTAVYEANKPETPTASIDFEDEDDEEIVFGNTIEKEVEENSDDEDFSISF